MLAAMRVMPKYAPASPPVAGYAAWYDASDAASITASGGAVSQWNDKSGNGYHLTQSNGTYKPTTGVSAINGLNVVTFASVSYIANNAFGTHAQPGYVFIAADPDGGGHMVNFIATVSVSFQAATFKPQLYAEGGDVIRGSVGWTAPGQATFLFSGNTNSLIRLDGTTIATAAGSNPGTVGLNTNIHVGSYFGDPTSGTYAYVGKIGEILIYTSNIGTANRDLVEAYLKAKWGTP